MGSATVSIAQGVFAVLKTAACIMPSSLFSAYHERSIV
jgi:hypothetical protein